MMVKAEMEIERQRWREERVFFALRCPLLRGTGFWTKAKICPLLAGAALLQPSGHFGLQTHGPDARC